MEFALSSVLCLRKSFAKFDIFHFHGNNTITMILKNINIRLTDKKVWLFLLTFQCIFILITRLFKLGVPFSVYLYNGITNKQNQI